MLSRRQYRGIGEGDMDERPPHLYLVPDPPASPPATAVTRTVPDRPAFPERRSRRPDGGPRWVMCRVCYSHPVLVADHLDLSECRVTFHCPLCGGASLVRWEDALAVGVAPAMGRN